MPTIAIDTADASELAELLQFLRDWLATDHQQLAPSLNRFVDNDAYDLDQLRHDLDRFTFLLAGNDGDPLFTGNQP